MESAIKTLEALFYEKIMVYQELVECLTHEGEVLAKTDIDALWEISDKKQSIVSRMEDLRGKILTTLSEAGIDHGLNVSSFDLTHVFSLIPLTHRQGFGKAFSSLVNLKAEIRRRSQENKLFVEECLEFLDELVGILANTGKSSDLYSNNQLSKGKGQANLLLHREV